MGIAYSYYGRLQGACEKTFADSLLEDMESRMIEVLNEMESAIKRHITECKREVIKEILRIERNATGQSYTPPPKEKVKYAK